MDILYQIRARQDSFSAGEGRIARLMLDDVGFAPAASLDELALTSGSQHRHAVAFRPHGGLPRLARLAPATGPGQRRRQPFSRPGGHARTVGVLRADRRRYRVDLAPASGRRSTSRVSPMR